MRGISQDQPRNLLSQRELNLNPIYQAASQISFTNSSIGLGHLIARTGMVPMLLLSQRKVTEPNSIPLDSLAAEAFPEVPPGSERKMAFRYYHGYLANWVWFSQRMDHSANAKSFADSNAVIYVERYARIRDVISRDLLCQDNLEGEYEL